MQKVFRFLVPAIALVGGLIATRSLAEPKENPAAADVGENATSPVRVQDMGAITFFHTTVKTTYEKMDIVGPIIEDLMKAVKEKNIDADGMVAFIYQGASIEPGKEFELSIGMTVSAGTEGFDKWQVKDLPVFKCATVMHSGHLKSIGLAYQKLFPELFAKGLQPTGESREFYMYWEGEDSDNNVMLVQVGVK